MTVRNDLRNDEQQQQSQLVANIEYLSGEWQQWQTVADGGRGRRFCAPAVLQVVASTRPNLPAHTFLSCKLSHDCLSTQSQPVPA